MKWWYVLKLLALSLVTLAWLTNVPKEIQPADELAIKVILNIQNKQLIRSFDDEIREIRFAQRRVLAVASGDRPIPNFADREPMDLLKAQSGWCYDRSRTLDKALSWLGFETRHVYILFADKGDQANLSQFVSHALSHSQSHAVTEVKTSRGWMLVDSNQPWISLNRDGEPVPADQVHQRRAEFDQPPEWVKTPMWAIQGMYSRTGQLYKPYIPFPEFNWLDFWSSI